MKVNLNRGQGWRKLATAAALAVFGLALIGLLGESASAGETARASGSATVDINHFAYHPPTLKVTAGSKVNFVNSSGVTHTATRGGSFDTGRIKPGHSVAVRFARKGTFVYHCTIHPFMHGKIVVQ
jgi:plastocyanin